MGQKIIQVILILIVSPFLFGLINKTKAFFAGRKGPPVLQLYYDIFKLFRKGVTYSKTVSFIFILGPIISLACSIIGLLIMPLGKYPSIFSFNGDFILLIYLFAMGRFFTVIAALDTGSSFEGMGASREVQFALFAEPALFLSIIALVKLSGKTSLTGILSKSIFSINGLLNPVIYLIVATIFIVFLAENCRIPVDDPNTHLELTMIHEVMVLDHGGVDFGFILYNSALKFWILGSFIAGLFSSIFSFGLFADILIFISIMFLLSIIVGIVESVLARLRLLKVPYFLMIGLGLSFISLIISLR
ncbi:MAG TPA: NADH-quinone oxidoreductase subunit H [Spirochaetota bacterium]|nr:NADH-quinone oxidoreductase subunit H [Spirochaetota bacterium]HOL56411.1 NADH-quinone oxidoreductase subunit H [Spirochaetota bacterium]HPP03895.1 NADH-quinone oxidoreductase subunit H [Spirochaetota bacterium]